jgi:pimeloyl-ACP methyl ester carboxylesterase
VSPSPRQISLANGLRLSSAEQGEPSAPAVVLLGGLTDSWRTYDPVLPHFPRSVHAIAVSARGHGESDKPQSGYRTADFARDVVELLDALDVDRAVLAGHSSASLVARRVAIDHPERVAGLVLEGSPTVLADDEGLAAFVSSLLDLEDPIDPEFVREFIGGTTAGVDDAFMNVMVAEAVKVPARVWREAFAGLLQDDDLAELGSIAAPTVLVWGDADGLVDREHQETLTRLIPSAELLVYPSVGHTPHWEAPERYARDITDLASRAAWAAP